MQSVLEAFTNREICGPGRSAVDQDQGQLKVALTSVVAVRKRRPNQRCTEQEGGARGPRPTVLLNSTLNPTYAREHVLPETRSTATVYLRIFSSSMTET